MNENELNEDVKSEVDIDLGFDNFAYKEDITQDDLDDYKQQEQAKTENYQEDSDNKNTSEKTKKKKPKKPKPETVSITQLFKYGDGIDKLLLLIGLVFSFLAAAVYPIMFWMYGRIATAFVDLQKVDNLNSTKFNLTNLSTINPCFQLSDSDTNFDDRIGLNVSYQIIFGFTSIVINYVAYVCFETAAERQVKKIRNMLFKSLITQEMAFFDRTSPGEINSKITSNIFTLKTGMGYKIADFISLIFRGIGCFVYAMISSWKFTIVFLAIMPFISILTTVLITFVKKYTIIELKSYEKAGKIAQEVLSSIRTVLSFGSMRYEVKKYDENLTEAEKMQTKKGLITGIFTGLIYGLFNSCFAIGLFYGTYLARTECDQFNPGDIVRSLFLMITMTFSIGQALPFLKDLAESRSAAKAVFDIIEKKSEIDVFDKANKIGAREIRGELSFENVHFSYPQRQEVKILKGLNLRIPAGKTIALCGSSGCGKSTTIQLLQRFYNPTAGDIKVDNVDLREYDLEWLRSQMSLVSQEPILFSTTIRENIRLGRLNATDAEIEEAAKCANAHNFIMSYPENYDTQVGERGGQLSGGQKQRIAIARAILRNPKILLLDEATSALDYESERIVQDALDKAKVGRTTIIIAHRLSTIRNADIIVGIADGQVKEIGNHQQLMELKGIYYDLVMSQTKKSSDEKGDQENEPSTQETKLTRRQVSNSAKQTTLVEMKIDEQGSKSNEKSQAASENIPSFGVTLKMWKYHRPELLYLIFGSIGQIFSGIVNPVVSLIFCEIYTIFAEPDPKKQERTSLQYMGIIFGIAVVNLIATLAYSYSFSLVGGRLTKRVRVNMFESLLRQEVAFHDLDENKSSYLASQLASSIPLCKGVTSDFLSIVCQALSSVGFSIIIGLVINWKLCLVIMAFIPINFISGFINSQSHTNKTKGKYNEEEGARIATEVVENIKTVVSLGRESYFYGEFKSVFNRNFARKLIMIHPQGLFYSVSNSVLFFIQATAFSYGYYLIKNENLTVSNLFRVYATITFSSMTLGRLFSLMPDTKKARNACLNAIRVIDRKSKIDSLSQEGITPDRILGEIKFKNVSFNYPNRSNLKILNAFNLHVKPGEVNALVGHSGCGKSTTISLLLRFYDIDDGSIELDGIDIRQLNINWLRSQIGLVSQEPVLFNLSVLENISYGRINDPNIPMTDIIAASRAANISDRIESLPQKYDTLVGTKGGQLSGGEKQRIAIARALLRSPRILLLDEATSALDNESEKIVQDALDKAQKGRTCIVIAHRLSTIQNANTISVVNQGCVVEEGTHSELIKVQGFYHRLQAHKNAETG